MNLPNQLTLLRIFLTPIFVLLLFMDTTVSQLGSFIVFSLASVTDWYDGYAARKFGFISTWGKFFDPLADKILVSSGFVSFSILGYVPVWMVIILVARDFFITILRSYAVIKKRPIETNVFAKAKTFFQFCVLYFIFLYHLLGKQDLGKGVAKVLEVIQNLNVIFALLCIITFLTAISGLIYLIENRSHLRQMGSDIYRMFVPSDI